MQNRIGGMVKKIAAAKQDLENLDRPGGMLLLGNLLLVFLALLQNWNYATIAWAYWCESVVIGLFLFFKYLLVAAHSRTGSKKIAYLLAFFFAIHWGIFHFAEVFVVSNLPFGINGLFAIPPTIPFVVALLILFLLQAYLFFTKGYLQVMDESEDAKLARELKNSFAGPYLRIAPIHFSLLLMVLVIASLSLSPALAANPSYAPFALAALMLFKTIGSLLIYVKNECL